MTEMLRLALVTVCALLFWFVAYVMAVTQGVRRAVRIAEWKTETEEDAEPAAQPTNAGQ